jgi:hypothetical protein
MRVYLEQYVKALKARGNAKSFPLRVSIYLSKLHRAEEEIIVYPGNIEVPLQGELAQDNAILPPLRHLLKPSV